MNIIPHAHWCFCVIHHKKSFFFIIYRLYSWHVIPYKSATAFHNNNHHHHQIVHRKSISHKKARTDNVVMWMKFYYFDEPRRRWWWCWRSGCFIFFVITFSISFFIFGLFYVLLWYNSCLKKIIIRLLSLETNLSSYKGLKNFFCVSPVC